MNTFLMFGRYSHEALKGISPGRTREGAAVIKKYGGKMQAAYALLGDKDLLVIADFPGVEQAMQASVALAKLTGIAFTTTPAVSVEDFDRIMSRA